VQRLTGPAALLAFSTALAGDSLDWLERMNAAVDGLNYRGTFVHLTGTESSTIKVVHRASGGPPGERVRVLDGEAREIVRTANETQCILPARRLVIVDPMGGSSLRDALPVYSGGIEEVYSVARLGRQLVSGRIATGVRVSPRDGYRFGYELWLDAETAMPLKTMTVADGGHRVVELMHFTEIEFPEQISDEALAPQWLEDDFSYHRPEKLQAPASREAAAQWTATRLPRGFRLSMSSRDVMASGRVGEHLVYTDGIASVSVFIEQAADGRHAAEASFARLGPSSAFSRRVDGHRIVVVGEVPADTVTLIGRSVRLRESLDR
jgi:sigma-E factor negative regulatory protein RseB